MRWPACTVAVNPETSVPSRSKYAPTSGPAGPLATSASSRSTGAWTFIWARSRFGGNRAAARIQFASRLRHRPLVQLVGQSLVRLINAPADKHDDTTIG